MREGIGYTAGVVINHHNIGDVHFSRGDLPKAWVAFSRSRELAEDMAWRRGVVLNDVYLGYIEATKGDVEGGLERIKAAMKEAEGLGDTEISANGALMAGRLLLEHGRETEAAELLDLAHAQATEFGLNGLLGSIAEWRNAGDEE